MPDLIDILGEMLKKEQNITAAATAQNPLAGKTAAELSGPTGIAELTRRYGAPSPYGQGVAFTTPEGVKHIRGAGAAVLEMPANYGNLYSPQDQKKIEALYADRSKIATDPELDRDEEARQAALDEIDSQISRVPRLAPMMREPSPQQQFDAATVMTPDGQKGYWDGKKFTPFEEGKGEQAYRDAYSKYLGAKMAAEAKTENPRPWEVLHREAKLQADLQFGRVQMPEPGQGMAPELNDEWLKTLANLKRTKWKGHLIAWGKATEEDMQREKADYILRAVNLGVPAEIAAADYLRRWKEAGDGIAIGQDLVAPMSDAMKKEAQYAFLDTLQATPTMAIPAGLDPFAFGTPRGGGSVTTAEGTATITPAPKGLEGIWQNLDEEDRAAVTVQMQRGVTARQILDTYKRAVGSQ